MHRIDEDLFARRPEPMGLGTPPHSDHRGGQLMMTWYLSLALTAATRGDGDRQRRSVLDVPITRSRPGACGLCPSDRCITGRAPQLEGILRATTV